MIHTVQAPDLRLLEATRFDLIVVGGGIHGCGIARDASMRGLKVALFEKNDFASATSSATSKLAHGGLRYLEQLRIGLVRESLRERETLLRLAPHLVRPLPFLLPIYDHSPRGRGKVAIGLTLYDLLARGSSMPRHRRLTVEDCLRREPRLEPGGLRGGFLFYDAQMNDARLVMENAISARQHGGQVWNHAEVEELLERNGRVYGVRLLDRRGGRRVEIKGSLVVNAAGPWYESIHARQGLASGRGVRLSRGSHVVVPPVTNGHALLLSARADGRVFFVLPWKGNSMIGTTDLEFDGTPDRVEATEPEIEYLLSELRQVITGDPPGRDDVLATFAGVRALQPGEESDVGSVSREAEVRLDAPGLLGVVGGKYTTYRAVSERVIDRATRLLELTHRPPCRTDREHLPGGDIPDMNDYFTIAEDMMVEKYGLDVGVLRYLLGTYGTRHAEVLRLLDEDGSLGQTLEDGFPFTRAEVLYAVREEMALTLEDVLWRRTYRAFAGPLPDEARGAWQDALRAAQDRCRV